MEAAQYGSLAEGEGPHWLRQRQRQRYQRMFAVRIVSLRSVALCGLVAITMLLVVAPVFLPELHHRGDVLNVSNTNRLRDGLTTSRSIKVWRRHDKIEDNETSEIDQQVQQVDAQTPQQLHLAYAAGATGTAMTVSWATLTQVDDCAVWIGRHPETITRSSAHVETVTYFQTKRYKLITHHAMLQGLSPHTTYYYRVGSVGNTTAQSDVYTFTTARRSGRDPANQPEIDREEDDGDVEEEAEEAFRIAVLGDLGDDHNAAATKKYLVEHVTPQTVDFVLHLGDISYADDAFLHTRAFFEFQYETVYNHWMNALSPVMARMPYMVLVGNHEAECHSPACFISSSKKDQLGNYSAYNARFRMPSRDPPTTDLLASSDSSGVSSTAEPSRAKRSHNMWYSFEHGPIHFTVTSSETDFPGAPKNSVTGREYGGFGDQLTWLRADLKRAHANRARVPWLIVAMHRAMYTRDECDGKGHPHQVAAAVQAAFEDLFLEFEVDVVLAGHVHLYERQFPIRKNQAVLDGVSSDLRTYRNPQAPVYINTGAAGNPEGHASYPTKHVPEWNALIENQHYGLSFVNVTQHTLYWQFVAAASGAVLDELTILRTA